MAVLLGLVAALGLAGRAAAQDTARKTDPAHQQHYWDCAKACDDCSRVCEACGTHCAQLVADGQKNHLKTVQTCQDCASICKAAGAVTARTGPFSDLVCQACADACKRCGAACNEHAAHDPIMKKCADECAACEKACREMLKMTGAGGGAAKR
jgi:hypothetical protein